VHAPTCTLNRPAKRQRMYRCPEESDRTSCWICGKCLGREDVIMFARLYITTSTRGSGGPSFQMKELRHMRTKCVVWTVGVSKTSVHRHAVGPRTSSGIITNEGCLGCPGPIGRQLILEMPVAALLRRFLLPTHDPVLGTQDVLSWLELHMGSPCYP
jgi:hypothetical protein